MERATVKTGNGQRGFTLIELLIVVTLVIVLAGIGLSTYSTSVQRAKEAVLRENLFKLRDSIDQFYADKGTWPPELSALVTNGYLRAIPKDPFTESADTWQVVMSEPDPANPNAAPGVYDVKSGAEGTSISGVPYSEIQ
jgi:general secretion pathway protein G